MSSNFAGYLIKFYKTNQVFPHELIKKGTYQSTPLQRTEIKAYRDSKNLLHRSTSPNYKSKVTFTTYPLELKDLQLIRNRLNSAFSNKQQRKLDVIYWDEELMNYRKMTAYMPDITYTVDTITPENIKYSGVEITFIEY